MSQGRLDDAASSGGGSRGNSVLFKLWRKWSDKHDPEEEGSAQNSEETPLEAASASEEATPKGATVMEESDEAPAAATQRTELPAEIVEDDPAETDEIDESDETDETDETDEAPDPVDAKVEVSVSLDKLSVSVNLVAPENGGADVTRDQVIDAILAAGIKTPIATAMVGLFVNNRKYDNPFKVSKGTPAIDGVDGSVKDCFPREKRFELGKREDGTVDFKDTNLVTDIPMGTVICEITLPTDVVPGMDVYGSTLNGRSGRAAVIPMGRNTEVAGEGLFLESVCSGNLRFVDGAFRVDETLVINQNVDMAVGNIKFSGDVVIDGAVCEGYSVHSDKNVTVNGTVEGASIYAGKDIVMAMGINGMNKGTLNAKGNVRGRFFENCSVKAGISVFAESIMNCTVQADDSIIVKGQRGVIVGGTYAALNLIEAKAVGASSNIPTAIYLGATMEMMAEVKRLKVDQEAAVNKNEELKKDVAYLDGQSESDTISQERKVVLLERKKQSAIMLMKISTYTKRLNMLNDEIEKCKDCRLVCSEIFPPVKIYIRSAVRNIKIAERGCFFYFADGEVKKGKS